MAEGIKRRRSGPFRISRTSARSPETGRYGDASPIRIPGMSRPSRAQRKDLPDHVECESVLRRTSSDPGRALLTGFVGGPAPLDDWNKLDVPQLRGISKTAPYFHNNSASTLEDVVDHYMAFFTQLRVTTLPGAPPPPPTTTDGVHFDRAPLPEERQALLAYLRKL